jgi:hypothetical protein
MLPYKNNVKTQLWLGQFNERPADRGIAEKIYTAGYYCQGVEFKRGLLQLLRKNFNRSSKAAIYVERELQVTRSSLPPPFYKSNKIYNARSGKRHLRAHGAAVQAVKSLRYNRQVVGSEGVVAAIGSSIARSQSDVFCFQPSAEEVRKEKVRNIVVLTDFVGSGERVYRMLDALWRVPSVRSWKSYKLVRFWVVCFSCTKGGENLLLSHPSKPTILTRMECPTLMDQFQGDELEECIELCERYGGFSKVPLGYKCSSALLAFEHGAPNNMPAIFICENKSRKKPWLPLFEKRATEYFWERSGFDIDLLGARLFEALQLSEVFLSRDYQRLHITLKLAIMLLCTYLHKKRGVLELRRVLPLSLDEIERVHKDACELGWINMSGVVSKEGRRWVDRFRRKGLKNLVDVDPYLPYYPLQLRAPL